MGGKGKSQPTNAERARRAALRAIGLKFCPKCGETKPFDHFTNDSSRSDGKSSWCPECNRAALRAHRLANPERHRRWDRADYINNKERHREAKRRLQYRLEPGQFDALLAAQGGGCGVCGSTSPGRSTDWHVDHDHACCPARAKTCGRCTRGLLCRSCNLMLREGRDSPDVLRAAIQYLETWKERTECLSA